MSATAIQWTDHSQNPIRAKLKSGAIGHYCEKISSGCANCYASKMQARFKMPSFPGAGKRDEDVEIFFDDEKLHEVLRRRKPTKYFWCDMSDMFGSWVPDEWIDKCFATMALTPQHTHQVLTKRPERMAEYTRSSDVGQRIFEAANALCDRTGFSDGWKRWNSGGEHTAVWPLPNVWLGTSVEDQKSADGRIPHLLRCQAAVRFLSCEPLLGAIDLSVWIGGIHEEVGRIDLPNGAGWKVLDRRSGASMAHSAAQEQNETRGTRSDVLAGSLDGRVQSSSCFGASAGVAALQRADSRRDDDQSQGWQQAQQPPLESRVGDIQRSDQACPISIGQGWTGGGKEQQRRIDARDGESDTNATSERRVTEVDCRRFRRERSNDFQSRARPSLDWIICGGESGPKARPCHIGWIDSIRDQCRAAVIPLFVKQLGGHVIATGAGENRIRLEDRKGGDMMEWPQDLRIREFPEVHHAKGATPDRRMNYQFMRHTIGTHHDSRCW